MRRGLKLGEFLCGELCLRRASACAVLVLECLLVWFSLSAPQVTPTHSRNELQASASQHDSLELDSLSSQTGVGLPGRPLFPYSVIPGGVGNEIELARALANDPVAAAHYQGFRLAKARVIRVNEARAVYVSYRLDSHIYWTRRTLRLAKGETLITDGEIAARTRCGNLISAVPLAPISPAEPAAEALENPEDPPLLAETNAPFDLPLAPPPESDIQIIGHHGGIFIPPFFPAIPGGPGSSPGIPVSPLPPPPPPIPTPEPGTLLLISVGLSSVWMLRKKQKS
jgi:hypothetical protein